MNNKEAIEFLKNMIDREAIGFVCPEREGDVAIWQYHVEALQMAISALQAQEEKTQLSAEGTTSDLISRQAAVDRIVWWFGILKQNPDILIDSIKTLPSAHSEIEKRKEESAQNVPKEDLISRKAAIDALKNERSDWNCDYNVPVDHCIDAIYSVPSAQPEPQWIPVSERVPHTWDERYLVSLAWGGIGVMEYKSTGFHNYGSFTPVPIKSITAWMPLPKPYRAERRTDEQT